MPSFLTEPRGNSTRKKKRSREKASNSVQYRPSHCHRSNTVEPCTMGEEGSSEVQGAGGKESD